MNRRRIIQVIYILNVYSINNNNHYNKIMGDVVNTEKTCWLNLMTNIVKTKGIQYCTPTKDAKGYMDSL